MPVCVLDPSPLLDLAHTCDKVVEANDDQFNAKQTDIRFSATPVFNLSEKTDADHKRAVVSETEFELIA